MRALDWVLRIIAAVILVQTLFFKFTAAPGSVFIFTTLGAEPWGRIGSGVFELLAALLLLVPATAWLGALLAVCAMLGAVSSHLLVLGLVVQDDGGLLFGLACTVLLSSLVVALLHREEMPILGPRLRDRLR